MSRPAVFLDRDGVINQDRTDYIKSWSEFTFVEGALDALRCLAVSPYAVVVVSNQSAVGRGLISQDVVDDIHRHMVEAVRRAGGRIDAVYYCPHAPNAGCACRKPRPGLILRAAREMDLDLHASWLVGDNLRDLQAAIAAGVRPVLVQTGHGKAVSRLENLPTDLIYTDLLDAVRHLLRLQPCMS
jgi:D-glycero-D-manno-heptose 1,7-bisphosphate phosphatase